MATRTSSQSGNWSDIATWGGDPKPGAGDIAVIDHQVTVDEDTTVGSKAAGIGHAFQVHSGGELILAAGKNFTCRGFDTGSNCLGRVDNGGIFRQKQDSVFYGDVASNYASVFDNRGRFVQEGAAGHRAKCSSPAGAYAWDNASGDENYSGSQSNFDGVAHLASKKLVHHGVANAGGTGIGSLGDSSIVLTNQDPGTILAAEVASLAAVTSVGKYFVDYDMGVVYFWHDWAGGLPTYTVSYKYLTILKGWGVVSQGAAGGCTFESTYGEFEYMGPASIAEQWCIFAYQHKSAAVAANRVLFLDHVKVRYCNQFLGLYECDGTAGDPLLINDVDFGSIGDFNYAYGATIGSFRSTSTFVKVSGGTAKCVGVFWGPATYGSIRDFQGWTFENLTLTLAAAFIRAGGFLTPASDFLTLNVVLEGVGGGTDLRPVSGLAGTAGHVAVLRDVTFHRTTRGVNVDSHLLLDRPVFDTVTHHGIAGSAYDLAYITDVEVRNPHFLSLDGTSFDDAAMSIGYNHSMWLDNVRFVNGTIVNYVNGWFGLGDQTDGGTLTACTRLTVKNNLALMTTASGSKGFRRRADSGTERFRAHVTQIDYNLDFNFGAQYENFGQQGTFTKGGENYSDDTLVTRNVTGVSLWDPNFASAAGKGLVYTHTSDTDRTLAFDGGTAVQLCVSPGGTSGGLATGGTNEQSAGLDAYGTLTDALAAFPTDRTNADCPQECWVVMLGGACAGQVRMCLGNTATRLDVTPSWTGAAPAATDPYVIVRLEVLLPDGGDQVRAGIYFPDLPTSSKSDSGISFADHSVTAQDPLLVLVESQVAADHKKGPGSPGIDAGDSVYAPATDFFGTARPQGGAVDMGFDEPGGTTQYTATIRATCDADPTKFHDTPMVFNVAIVAAGADLFTGAGYWTNDF